MNLLTTAARTWLTRSPEPFRFTADNDEVLDYDDCPGLGLYVHIPFCRTLCNFCPYCKERYTPEAAGAYTAALLQEIEMVGRMRGERTRVSSLYFGGGTPALLAVEQGRIIEALRQYFDITDGVGAELHPADVNEKTLRLLRDAGVTRISIGIQSFLPEFARPLTELLKESLPRGVLVISPPAGGKTTFLRSAAYLLATGSKPYRVGIADERCELFLPAGLCDRITGCPKCKAVELWTRTMSPEYLICDELGAGEEVPLLAAQNTGVKLIASVHGSSVEEAARRPCVKALLEGGVFSLFAVLKQNFRVEIFPAGEVLAWS